MIDKKENDSSCKGSADATYVLAMRNSMEMEKETSFSEYCRKIIF